MLGGMATLRSIAHTTISHGPVFDAFEFGLVDLLVFQRQLPLIFGIDRGAQAMALPTSKMATKQQSAMTPAPPAHEPLSVTAEPGRGVAEGHELIDPHALTV